MKKRLFAVFLSICMMMTLLPITAFAEEDVLFSPDTYSDVSLETAKTYLSGNGTKEEPFQIWYGDDLYYINYIEYWNGLEDEPQVYYYQQMQDLDLSNASQFDKATGYITANFGGVYDGGGYAITGLSKSLFYFTKGSYIGDNAGAVFTGYVSGSSHDKVFSAVVRNLVIREPNITQTVATDVIEQLGAVAAYAVNTTFYNIRVEGGRISGISGAAAIAGRAGSVVIDSCSSNAEIYTSMHRAAGIVSNLRIVDAKKGATATSLVTNCTFSGNISGNLDGERGSAGIVGAVYMDGTSELRDGAGLPLYVTECTFSGTLTGTVTSGQGNFGGILGTSYLGPGLYLRDNTVTGTIRNVTVEAGATAANVGGIVGKMLNYSLLSSDISLVMEGNDASRATLPATNPEGSLYVGTQLGCLSDLNRTVTGPISISTSGTLGEYGSIQGAQLAGNVGDLILPASSGSTQLYILEETTVGDITAGASTGLTIYNYGTVGNVTNTAGVNIYANTGSLGSVTSQNGAIVVGYGNKTAETAGTQVGNSGTIGNLTSTAVTIYRNTGTIGSVESKTSNVTIGQGNSTTAGVADYNINSGAIGSVTAATSVSIHSGQVTTGSVAARTGETLRAATSVTIGASGCPNCNDVGNVAAGTTVSLYTGTTILGDIQAGGNVNLYANTGTIGNVTSTGGTVTVGNGSQTAASTAGQVGNEGHLGNISGTGVTIHRNTGTIGGLTATTGAVTIGQGNSGTEGVRAYNVNAGTIGSVTAATTVALYSGVETAGSVAAGSDQSVNAVTSVTIGTTTYPNYNTVGAVKVPTVSGYTVSPVGTVTATYDKLIRAYGSEEGNVIVADANVTLTADDTGAITANGQTYPANSKLVLTKGVTVTFGGEKTVALSVVESNGNVVLLDGSGVASIGSVSAVGNVTLGNASTVFGGKITGDVTAGGGTSASVTVGSSSKYFTGTIGGNISAVSGITIYNSGTIGASDKTIATETGNVTITNGKSGETTGTIASDVVNNSTTGGTLLVTNNSTPMAGAITQNSTGNLTLSGGAGTAAQFTGQITVARALSVNGNIGPNQQDNAIKVAFSGTSGTISVANHSFYLAVTGSNLTALSVASSATTQKNTVDLSGIGSAVSVSKAVNNAEATSVILPEGATQPTDLGTSVSGTISADQGDDTYANGSITVSTGVSLSADGTLTITASSATITNYGTIGAVNHLGTGTLTIYNIGQSAQIGNINSAGAVYVGGSNKTASNNNSTAVGNEGTLGNITAGGAVNIYRNTGTIGDVESQTLSVAIGQGNSTTTGVADYNVNSGTIGSVDAATTVSIHSGQVTTGSVAAGEGQTIKAGGAVTIGAAAYPSCNKIGPVDTDGAVTVYQGAAGSVGSITAGGAVTIGAAALANGGSVGAINAGTTVGIYNGSASIGAVNAAGNVTLYANGGQMETITSSGGTITVGADNKTADNNGGVTGNEGTLGDLTAYSAVSVKRNTGTIGKLTSETSSVNIGQNNSTYADYNTNAGTIGSVDAATSVGIYAASTAGRVAAKEDETIRAGTSVAIGADKISNGNTLGPVYAGTTVSVYNGAATLDTIDADSTVYLYGNSGTIGAVTSAGSIQVGDSGKTDATAAGRVGNSGTIGDLEGTAVTVYRNISGGTIGDVTATTGNVTIGQSNSTTAGVPDYNVNAGTVGSVNAATNVAIYSTVAGSVATGSDQTVTAGGTVTIGTKTYANGNNVGPATAGTSVTLYNGTGAVSSLTAGTTAAVYVNNGSADVNVTTGSGDISIVDQTTAAGPSVNAATAGGDVEVSRADGDTVTDIYTKVNLTVTDGLGAGQTLFIRGQFASVVHRGAGDVIMESADTAVTNIILQSTGSVEAYGSAGNIITPGESQAGCLLSLVPVSVGTVDVYLLTADGTALSGGSLDLTAVGGTFTAEPGAVAGGGASEKVGTVVVDTNTAGDVTVTVSGTFTPDGGQGISLAEVACPVTIPAAIERVDTVLLTSQEEFNAAAEQYGWNDTEAPTDYPVLAVMPVIHEAYDGFTPEVEGTQVNSDGVALLSVDVDAALAEEQVAAIVTIAGDGVPDHSGSYTYELTQADLAKLDAENDYWYVTLIYMDGTTADVTVPVVQGESLVLPTAADRAGYTFLGWSDGSAIHTAGTGFAPTADTVLTAQWGADSVTYTLTINITGSGSVVRVVGDQEYPITSGTSFMDGDTVTLKAIRGSGYSFSSWTVGDTKTYEDTVTVTMDSNQTVTAEFYAVSSGGSTSVSAYGITVGSVANGTIKVTPTRAAKGATVTITATPDAGYELSSIQVETVSGSTVTVTKDSAGQYTFTMPAQAVRIIAAFSEVQEVTNPFTDVAESAWYYKAVKYVYEQGMMTGTNDGTTFSPTMELTRGMMAQVLYNIEQGSAPAGSAFTDVVSGAWYADAVNWAAANGIVGGYGNGTFGPEDSITREQMAVILFNYANFKGYDMAAAADLSTFTDGAQVSGWAQYAMQWAVAESLMQGSNNTLNPLGTASRAEVAQMLMNFCEVIAK